MAAKKDKPLKTMTDAQTEGKSKALELALESIEKQFGKGSIMKLGEGHKQNVETFPTGALSLDLALGGGIPKGRVVEIYGPESSGKTTLTLHAIAEVQRNGGTAAFIDAEHALGQVDVAVVPIVLAGGLPLMAPPGPRLPPWHREPSSSCSCWTA